MGRLEALAAHAAWALQDKPEEGLLGSLRAWCPALQGSQGSRACSPSGPWLCPEEAPLEHRRARDSQAPQCHVQQGLPPPVAVAMLCQCLGQQAFRAVRVVAQGSLGSPGSRLCRPQRSGPRP